MLVPGGQETCSMNFYKLWSWRSMSTPRWKDFEVRLFILFGPLGLHDYILGLFLFFLPSPSPHIPVKESKQIFKADTHKDKKENRKTDRNTDRQTERQEQSQRPIRRNSPLAPLRALLLQAECLPPHVVQLILILAPGLPAVMIPTVSYRDMAGCSSRTSFKMLWSSVVLMWGLGVLALSWKRSLSVFLHWPHGSLRSSPLWTSLCETTKCDSQGRSETIEH